MPNWMVIQTYLFFRHKTIGIVIIEEMILVETIINNTSSFHLNEHWKIYEHIFCLRTIVTQFFVLNEGKRAFFMIIPTISFYLLFSKKKVMIEHQIKLVELLANGIQLVGNRIRQQCNWWCIQRRLGRCMSMNRGRCMMDWHQLNVVGSMWHRLWLRYHCWFVICKISSQLFTRFSFPTLPTLSTVYFCLCFTYEYE